MLAYMHASLANTTSYSFILCTSLICIPLKAEPEMRTWMQLIWEVIQGSRRKEQENRPGRRKRQYRLCNWAGYPPGDPWRMHLRILPPKDRSGEFICRFPSPLIEGYFQRHSVPPNFPTIQRLGCTSSCGLERSGKAGIVELGDRCAQEPSIQLQLTQKVGHSTQLATARGRAA